VAKADIQMKVTCRVKVEVDEVLKPDQFERVQEELCNKYSVCVFALKLSELKEIAEDLDRVIAFLTANPRVGDDT
jgi:hypothetical protein